MTVKITKGRLDSLMEQAKASPRLRKSLDLRNSPADQSQGLLNAVEPFVLHEVEVLEGTVKLPKKGEMSLYDVGCDIAKGIDEIGHIFNFKAE